MNERDSESIAAQCIQKGHQIVPDEKVADIVILNTCSVREQAEIKAIGKSGHLARKKRNNPNFKIGIVGCMAENLGAELFNLNPAIDFVVGPQRIHELCDLFFESSHQLRTGIPTTNHTHTNFDRNLSKNQHSAFISIMQGCNMRCSYCIVPKTRGREYYRPMNDIVDEAIYLAQNGIKEITLLGQIVNKYGNNAIPHCDNKSPFVQLLERLNGIDGIQRIRYISPHPSFFSDDLIEAHHRLHKLCPSIHFPVQSGSDRILKEMRRPYTRQTALSIIEKLRTKIPTIGISTDIIVGYPGESEQDFQDTVSLLEEARFNLSFIFKYSPRTGTKSATLIDNIPEQEKERRNSILLEKASQLSLNYNQQFINTTAKVFVEGHAKRGDNMLYGWTPQHCKVIFEGSDDDFGQILPIKITDCTTTILLGNKN